MNRRSALVLTCLLGLGLLVLPAPPADAAPMHVEIIQLHNRTAEEAIPLLRPFLVPGGAMSGTGYKLIVKTTPENLADIKKMLQDIDAGLREMVISVRQGSAAQSRRQRAAARGEVHVGSDSTVTAGGDGIGPYAGDGGASAEVHGRNAQISGHISDTQSQTEAPAEQHIRVLEGQWANITTGMAMPVILRQRNPDGSITATVQYKEITSGFQVLPRVSGNRVTLHIRPTRSSLSRQGGGVVNTQQAETTVSGNLGQWIEIGGVSQSTSSSTSGIASRRSTSSAQSSTISVKVDLAQ
ncbi:MAG TPA: hypothetical protein VKA50_13275 [Gammaproteobacteria bacterium]|nr:hypothetical protein [Gammaproteobacteria bacterium]